MNKPFFETTPLFSRLANNLVKLCIIEQCAAAAAKHMIKTLV